MLGRLQLWGLRKKLRSSLAADPLQGPGWDAWLDGAGSLVHLRTSCPQPGWLVHCAYWAELPQDLIFRSSLAVAELARKHGPADVFPRDSVYDLRGLSFPELAQLVVGLERRFPGIARVDHALPSQSNYQLGVLEEARGGIVTEPVDSERDLREDDEPELDKDASVDAVIAAEDGRGEGAVPHGPIDLTRNGPAGAAAAGYVLTIIGMFHAHVKLKESLVFAAAGAASLFALAAPALRPSLLATLREAYGWPHSMTQVEIVK